MTSFVCKIACWRWLLSCFITAYILFWLYFLFNLCWFKYFSLLFCLINQADNFFLFESNMAMIIEDSSKFNQLNNNCSNNFFFPASIYIIFLFFFSFRKLVLCKSISNSAKQSNFFALSFKHKVTGLSALTTSNLKKAQGFFFLIKN